ncbi:hypothetical protein [Halopenitus malekzadehii]|nr:hypothetical protein [Halopenitus malekzadehii]
MGKNKGQDDTSIRLKISTWNRLKDRKTHPNESFDDVINDLIDLAEEAESEGNSNPAVTSN